MNEPVSAAELNAPASLPELLETVQRLTRQLETAETRLREVGMRDPDSDLFSYRYFLGRLSEEVARADRFGTELSCLMIALDQPEPSGLAEVAQQLKDACRQYDVPARWGRHELVMLLPETDLDGAQTFAERFRLRVASHFEGPSTLSGLTISVGLTTYPGPGVEDAEQLLACADAAAFHARSEGGNRTFIRQANA
ncbi:MAG: GGDEF domain-containing protein [Candidatus Sericytochromatia bacterium]|nr:GGDEF domain-containing protein [Candidatus Sericytochromatia bacterium]